MSARLDDAAVLWSGQEVSPVLSPRRTTGSRARVMSGVEFRLRALGPALSAGRGSCAHLGVPRRLRRRRSQEAKATVRQCPQHAPCEVRCLPLSPRVGPRGAGGRLDLGDVADAQVPPVPPQPGPARRAIGADTTADVARYAHLPQRGPPPGAAPAAWQWS